MHHGLTPD